MGRRKGSGGGCWWAFAYFEGFHVEVEDSRGGIAADGGIAGVG